jgi:hypothetical protein
MLNFNRQLLIQSIILAFPCQIKRRDCVWHGNFLLSFFLVLINFSGISLTQFESLVR